MLLIGFMAENCPLDLPAWRVEMMVVTQTSGESSISQNMEHVEDSLRALRQGRFRFNRPGWGPGSVFGPQ